MVIAQPVVAEWQPPDGFRPIGHDASMADVVPPEVVPEKIQSAEEWRVLGERLRELNPEMYEQVFQLLVLTTTGSSDEKPLPITKSYFFDLTNARGWHNSQLCSLRDRSPASST